jgi:hypothetical protein
MGAVDMVPLRPVTRQQLMSSLCRIHLGSGSWNNIGLGFYKGLRFHIDARKFREWGTAGAGGGWGCTAVLAQGAAPNGSATGPVAVAPAAPPFPAKIVYPPSSDPLAPHR